MSTARMSDVAGRGEPASIAELLQAGKKVAPDVTALLMQDHREAIAFFDWYEAADPTDKPKVAETLCTVLKVHMRIEEEIFYPAARRATGDEDLVEDAIDEHEEAKALIEEVEAGGSASSVEQTMGKLRAAIEQHVAEEEAALIPEVLGSEMDIYAVGQTVAARRGELLLKLTGKGPSKS